MLLLTINVMPDFEDIHTHCYYAFLLCTNLTPCHVISQAHALRKKYELVNV